MPERKTILVVDDEKDNLEIMKFILEYQNFEVLTACDGRVGIDEAIKHLPDLIILDVKMPVMDGFTACREIKKSPMLSAIPVIILTSKSMGNDKIEAMAAGADAFMIKPVETDLLMFKINGFFGKALIPKKKSSQNIVKWGDYQKKIMIVDDDPGVRKILTALIEGMGFAAYQSSNGKKAMDSLLDNPDIDLLIADMIMPEMGGKQLINIIRGQERFAKLPIILISAILKKEEIEDVLKLGDIVFLEKPIMGAKLKEYILDSIS